MTLTQHQQNILQFIKEYQIQSGISPSVREICEHFNLKSPGGVHRILHVLINKGYLTCETGKKRAWRLTDFTPQTQQFIPLLGKIAAGIPIVSIENKEDILPVPANYFGAENCFALHVRGDSMIDAHILEDDIAIIHPQTDADNQQIVAVTVSDIQTTATLKYFIKKQHCIELHSANKRYPAIIFKGEEQSNVTIIGKYIGIIRRGV